MYQFFIYQLGWLKINKNNSLFALIVLCLLLTSCQTAPLPTVYIPPKEERETIQHIVSPGETLWRLSQVYDVPESTIRRANRLRRNKPLKLGQKLRIPGASYPIQVINMPPSTKWEYIIIHHTATDAGNSLSFHKSHLAKGWDRGIGYHFLINNDSGNKADGFVEITPRWIKQEDGAHCKASDMNTKAIGISLVGNFSDNYVPETQFEALIDLVKKLKKFYNIPTKNVLQHGEVHGSSTECPGTNFPWKKFQRKIR